MSTTYLAPHSLTPLVEIRIPTYQRPNFLHEALSCIIKQSYHNWNAIVLDDSPSLEGKSIATEFSDSRIHYRNNSENLGICKNLSHSFSDCPLLDSAASLFAVLEDDNRWDPKYLEVCIGMLMKSSSPAIVSNYRVDDVETNGSRIKTSDEPMLELYGNDSRLITLRERQLNAIGTFSIGNLAWIWRRESTLNLKIQEEKFNQHVQERMRAVAAPMPILYNPVPHSSFARFTNKAQQTVTPGTLITKPSIRLQWYRYIASEVRFLRNLRGALNNNKTHRSSTQGIPELGNSFGDETLLNRLAADWHFLNDPSPSFRNLLKIYKRKVIARCF